MTPDSTSASARISAILFFVLSLFTVPAQAQVPAVNWQKSIGTVYSDEANMVFSDDEGNIVMIGQETHVDFAGIYRTYLLISKYDLSGQEIYSAYHDVALQTFSPPLDYSLHEHFYSEQDGQKLINISMHIANRDLLYQLMDADGSFYSFSEIAAPVFSLSRDNIQNFASQQCSYSAACYGPDSLIVENFDPSGIFGEPTRSWTYTDKQSIRTAPIQGHYDYNNQDIARDEEGNVYLLTQIERYDFQFCTDCGDAFVDAYSEIFKFDTSGQLVKHFKLKTAKAIISNMRFVKCQDGTIIVKIDDVNAAVTDVLSSIYYLDYDLNLQSQFSMDRQYRYVLADAADDIYACNFLHDAANPQLKGLADCMLSKYSHSGTKLWTGYYGGSGYDYPRDIALTADGGIVIIARSDSDDFDVSGNHGFEDIWLVKLGGSITSGLTLVDPSELTLFPNPAREWVNINGPKAGSMLSIFDLSGRELLHTSLQEGQPLDIRNLDAGCYIVKSEGKPVRKLVKMK